MFSRSALIVRFEHPPASSARVSVPQLSSVRSVPDPPLLLCTISHVGSHLLRSVMTSGEREIALNLFPHGRSARNPMSRKGKNRRPNVPEDEVALLAEEDNFYQAEQPTNKMSKDKSRTIPFRPSRRISPIQVPSECSAQPEIYGYNLPPPRYLCAIGFIATYIAPLAFVLSVTMGKEAWDDILRNRRDREANAQRYLILEPDSTPLASNSSTGFPPTRATPSSQLQVGDLVQLTQNQRVPADMILLRTSDPSGTCFVRTDQLDGETDWKLRVAVPACQSLHDDWSLLGVSAEVYGMCLRMRFDPDTEQQVPQVTPLTAENMLWSNTVLAAGSAIGMVVYTGKETRAVMNTSHPETKVGLLDLEINRVAKILCAVTFALSVLLVALNGFRGQWYIYVFRFLILFSSIIPISLRVNLDMGKTVYAHQIESDSEIPGTIVRTSTLPEELGRIEYLLSDKTGTLTQNEMEMRKLHLGTISYGADAMDEVAHQLVVAFGSEHSTGRTSKRQGSLVTGVQLASRGRRDISSRVRDVVLALALCHNVGVTPVTNDDGTVTYQASSPDEVAIVKWTESVGLTLTSRTRTQIELQTPDGTTLVYSVLALFPFTSESKRMGIVVQSMETHEIMFVQKGADTVMARLVQRSDWLEEETANMAREGLRTLVCGRRRLTSEEWAAFETAHKAASVRLEGRAEAMAAVVGEHLERGLELLGLTGVEDKLQEDVRATIELLRNAGIRIWMLTGDKVETATCIAISTKLVARNQYIHQIAKLKSPDQARDQLDFLQSKLDCCLVIDGESLQVWSHFENEFIEIATKLTAVVACRCSPTQKADVARLIRRYTRKRVCCIGDGGNDVSMIQASDVGVGIVGKEGKQASLAADFSVTQFSYLTKLLVWHGRNSYKRSAKLAQFVIHRGLIISVMQAVFSAIFYFAPIALYQGWLMVGYATVYTMAPVFSLVLDRDVNEDLALLYPELYKELTKTFFTWCVISVYQGGAIMIMSLLLFENEFLNIVAISFTALVLNELIMVALEITTWYAHHLDYGTFHLSLRYPRHLYMVIAEIVTLIFYAISMAFLPEYFDLSFVVSLRFAWKVALIVCVSSVPLWLIKTVRSRVRPATYSKLT
ncbi:phospholipid-translocating P-type ATPase, putative [Rhizoctonia solani AG-1 IA]|uniref:Phospholipid-transporting ATPase n=1 Tax=Thanatephorus cucumeris (strain AG1-IA) TaxID=983506 RepID=L8WPN8_THACA|nr:phospholipid-translocating P-type ATPase, putative [Rhizoctonia solani AG-1 IA]